jgi:hypothetical protein
MGPHESGRLTASKLQWTAKGRSSEMHCFHLTLQEEEFVPSLDLFECEQIIEGANHCLDLSTDTSSKRNDYIFADNS